MRRITTGTAFFVLLCVSFGTYRASPATPGGSIAGVVKLTGEGPKPKAIEVTTDLGVCGGSVPRFEETLLVGPDHGIANAVVSITDASSGAPAPSQVAAKPVRMEQRRCRYEPHVLAFPAGTTIEIVNADGILHNVHTHSKLNRPINLAQPGFKKMLRVKLSRPEAVQVTCDEHNWMSGWWFVTSSPYYAVTDRAGRYEIKDIPPGHYRLQVWQEELGTLVEPVTVEAGHTTKANFVMNLTKGGS